MYRWLICACSSAVEHLVYTQRVGSSKLSARTKKIKELVEIAEGEKAAGVTSRVTAELGSVLAAGLVSMGRCLEVTGVEPVSGAVDAVLMGAWPHQIINFLGRQNSCAPAAPRQRG